MPILFVIIFIALGFIIPRFMKYFVIAPILAFTFGGFFWAIGGFVGLASFSLHSFFLYQVIALLLIEVWMFTIE